MKTDSCMQCKQWREVDASGDKNCSDSTDSVAGGHFELSGVHLGTAIYVQHYCTVVALCVHWCVCLGTGVCTIWVVTQCGHFWRKTHVLTHIALGYVSRTILRVVDLMIWTDCDYWPVANLDLYLGTEVPNEYGFISSTGHILHSVRWRLRSPSYSSRSHTYLLD